MQVVSNLRKDCVPGPESCLLLDAFTTRSLLAGSCSQQILRTDVWHCAVDGIVDDAVQCSHYHTCSVPKLFF